MAAAGVAGGRAGQSAGAVLARAAGVDGPFKFKNLHGGVWAI